MLIELDLLADRARSSKLGKLNWKGASYFDGNQSLSPWQVVCASLCVGTSFSDPRESQESREDGRGELRIPYPEKVLNSGKIR